VRASGRLAETGSQPRGDFDMNDDVRDDVRYDTTTDTQARSDGTIATEARTDATTGQVVVASFADRGAAEAAVDQLRDAGYDREKIGFATRDDEGETVLVEEHGNAAGSGALGGVVTGAAAGGALAWLGLAAIPAIGPFIAAGAIGTTLIGAGAGAVTGGVLGGLLGLGIPRHQAEYHEEQLRQGRTLVTVRTDEPGVAARLLSNAGAVEVDEGNSDALLGEDDQVRDATVADREARYP
jgi:hypothetical protein